VRREQEGEAPLEAILHRFNTGAHRVVGPHINVAQTSCAIVVARQQAVVRSCVDELGVGGVGSDPTALTSAYCVPVGLGDGSAVAAACGFNGAVVLLGAVDVVRKVLIERNAVELAGRLVHHRAPAGSAIERDVCSAVVGLDHAIRIVVGDPEIMIVAVRSPDLLEVLPAVGGLEEAGVDRVDRVRVLGIGKDTGVVPGTLLDVALVVDLCPRRACVVAMEDAAVFSLYIEPYTA
jgi:hypothetical protein